MAVLHLHQCKPVKAAASGKGTLSKGKPAAPQTRSCKRQSNFAGLAAEHTPTTGRMLASGNHQVERLSRLGWQAKLFGWVSLQSSACSSCIMKCSLRSMVVM